MLRTCLLTVAACLVLLSATVTLAQIPLDVDLGPRVDPGDATAVYQAITARYFGTVPEVVARLEVRYGDADDLAVGLFVGDRSGAPADRVLELRSQGLTWWNVARELDLSPAVWFVETEENLPDPFGRVYGHWRRHEQDPRYVVVVTDIDAQNLVAARVMHEYFDIPLRQAMTRRAGGDNLRYLVADEYVRRREAR